MRNPLILAVGLAMIAGAAMAHDPSGRPEAGAFVPHEWRSRPVPLLRPAPA